MKPAIIYTSYTGTTHAVAQKIHDACGGDLIEVKSWDLLSRLFMYFVRRSPDMQVRDDGVPPMAIDLSGYDLVVIGTPVWMGKPTMAIQKTIAALTGCNGKPVILFATCGEDPGTTLPVLSGEVKTKGMTVAGRFSLSQKEIADGAVIRDLIANVQGFGGGQ